MAKNITFDGKINTMRPYTKARHSVGAPSKAERRRDKNMKRRRDNAMLIVTKNIVEAGHGCRTPGSQNPRKLSRA